MEDSPICVADPYDLILAEGIDEVYRLMEPCRNCGELRPRGDVSMSSHQTCHLCKANPAARKRDTRDIIELWERMDEGAFEDECDGSEGTADEHETFTED